MIQITCYLNSLPLFLIDESKKALDFELWVDSGHTEINNRKTQDLD